RKVASGGATARQYLGSVRRNSHRDAAQHGGPRPRRLVTGGSRLGINRDGDRKGKTADPQRIAWTQGRFRHGLIVYADSVQAVQIENPPYAVRPDQTAMTPANVGKRQTHVNFAVPAENYFRLIHIERRA